MINLLYSYCECTSLFRDVTIWKSYTFRHKLHWDKCEEYTLKYIPIVIQVRPWLIWNPWLIWSPDRESRKQMLQYFCKPWISCRWVKKIWICCLLKRDVILKTFLLSLFKILKECFLSTTCIVVYVKTSNLQPCDSVLPFANRSIL